MMSVRKQVATKKALREYVAVARDAGQKIPGEDFFLETSVFGPEYRGDGVYAVAGPSPYQRKWYASVVVEGGSVVKVS